ncbi:hypothetical protein V2J09_011551 [Rumex salicifolius]
MANKKNPTPIKPKKPGWIRACFGLGPSHEARLEKGQLSGEEEVTRGGGKRRKLGLPEKKEAEATSFSEVKVAGILLLDDGSHEAHEPTGSEIQKPKPIVEEDGLKNAKRSEKDSLMGMSILITNCKNYTSAELNTENVYKL